MSTPTIMLWSDVAEKNGKTVRENNMEKLHAIPLGTLVEVSLDYGLGNGGFLKGTARLWIGAHSRDCDGTPLYTLVENMWAANQPWVNDQIRWAMSGARHGFAESQLSVVNTLPIENIS